MTTPTRQLRFTFHRLTFRNGAGIRGRTDVAIEIQVDGIYVNNPYDLPIQVRPRATVDIEALGWTGELDAADRTDEIPVRVLARFDEPGNTNAIGEITRNIAWPFQPRHFRDTVAGFIVDWEIEQVDNPNVPPPVGAPVCREDAGGGVMYSTVGPTAPTRVVIAMHDVLPVPPQERAPTLPRFARGTPAAFTDHRAYTAAQLSGGALNMIENPACIPIMPSGTTLDDSNCSRFRITYYRPRTLAFTEDDARLEWNIVSLADGGNAAFHGRRTGTKIALHGVRRGEIGLECRFLGTLVAQYRALVEPLVKVPCRFTELHGSTNPRNRGLRARFGPARMQGHLKFANQFLWQLGLQLEPDTDASVGWLPRGVAAANVQPVAGQDGFFTAIVPRGWTAGFDPSVRRASAVNSREWVVNFAYVASAVLAGMIVYGEAQSFETAGGNVTDKGTPSTSWISPSGVRPAAEAREHKMRIFATLPHPTLAHRFALYVTNANTDDFFAAGTVAHEFGHALGLMHRLEWPGLRHGGVQYPWNENLMHRENPTTISQDLDIIQARAVRKSPLVTHWAAPPPPPPPPGPLPILGP